MKQFIKHYAKALLIVLTSMVAYGVIVVPQIEPHGPVAELPEFSDSFDIDKWWGEMFAAGDWQLNKPTIIQNKRGVLLAENWEQVDETTWRLQPLTMILPASDSSLLDLATDLQHASRDMWLVNAEEGAVIHFDAPLDLQNGSLPSVKHGQLAGAITIERRSIGRPNERPWSLTTSDVAIDRCHISTPQPVTIQWGTSRVRGRDLRITLRNEVLGENVPLDGDDHPWGPLDELELYRLEEMDVELPNGGLWSGVDASLLPDGTPDVRQLPARLSVASAGRLFFDFDSSEVTLTNGVHVKHHLANLPPDEFLSHKLTIRIAPMSAAAPQAPGLTGMRISEIMAVGLDALQAFVGEKWVELKSPLMNTFARAKRLRIELDRQRVTLAGKLDQPGATQSIAWLNYQGHEVSSPLIEYQASPRGDDGQTLHGGWLAVDGPGEMTSSANSEVGLTHVRWQRSLTMRPGDLPGEQYLQLLGNALIENETRGLLASDQVEAWLKRESTHQPSLAMMKPATGSGSSYVPDRILASGKTVVSTGELVANVESLFLKLIFVPESAPEPEGIPLNDSVGNPLFQFIAPPTNHNSNNSNNSTVSQPAPLATEELPPPPTAGRIAQRPIANSPHPEPSRAPETDRQIKSGDSAGKRDKIAVHGTSLDAAIVSRGSSNWIDALTIEGPVVVHNQPPRGESSPAPRPWQIEGDQLRLNTNVDGQANLQIDGQPARIKLQDGYVVGPSIRLDQQHNRMWIDHPGQMAMPLTAMQQPAGGNQVRWIKAPLCTWGGRLQFDGAVIHILGDIKLEGAVQRPDDILFVDAYCQRMEVNLAAPVDFTNGLDANRQAGIAVQRVVMRDDVDIRLSQRDLLGERQSLQRMVLPLLTFYVPENKIVGNGLGWIDASFPAEGTPLVNSPPKTAAANYTDSPQTRALQGAHLSFRDSVVGFLDRREVVFDGKVELVTGPISKWGEAIDPAKLMQLARGQMLLNCDQLKAYDTSHLSSTSSFVPTSTAGRQGLFNFQATGNVTFEGHTESGRYQGDGYRVTYEQAKNQLILVGDGRTPARLHRFALAEAKDSGAHTVYVHSATINVETLALIDSNISQYDFSAVEPGKPAGSLAAPPTVPPVPPPSPRLGVDSFLRPRP